MLYITERGSLLVDKQALRQGLSDIDCAYFMEFSP